jgi:hypothetical protein
MILSLYRYRPVTVIDRRPPLHTVTIPLPYRNLTVLDRYRPLPLPLPLLTVTVTDRYSFQKN